mgnify:CR=1 FL=1
MKSYTFGLLQTNAFKGLKGFTASLLKPYKLTTYEWALLGILYDEKKGLGTTNLAKQLKVSKPFITKTIRALTEKGWVEKSSATETDLRNIRFILTPFALEEIPKIETHLKTQMKKVLSGIPRLQLLAYVLVLKHISKRLSQSADDSAYEVEAP